MAAATAAFQRAGRQRGEQLYGPFKTAREAKKTLHELAREHRLCHGLLGLEKLKPGRPCFAHQVQQCKGACVGKEPVSFHSARLMAALARLQLRTWPFPGPAWLREGDEVLLFDQWRHLGTVRDDAEFHALLESPLPPFDRDTYRILLGAVERMSPLTSQLRQRPICCRSARWAPAGCATSPAGP
jgi:DNA polymerase-3 subunit epsilon